MIDSQTAVSTAAEILGKVMPHYRSMNPEVDELRLSKDGKYWNITFRASNPDSVNRMGVFPYIDKVVTVRVDTGEMIAIQNPSYDE